MTFNELNDGDLFLLDDGVASDVYRKYDENRAIATMYATTNGWIPYRRAEDTPVNLGARVKRVTIVLNVQQ